MNPLLDLAARCEAATAGQQSGLLWEAGGLVHGTDEPEDSHSPHAWFVHYAQAEARLDAAMTLVPEGWGALIETRAAHARVYQNSGEIGFASLGCTPALALCAAALRARAAL